MSKLGAQNLPGNSLRALSSLSQASLGTGLGQTTVRVAMVSKHGIPMYGKQIFHIPSPPGILFNFIKLLFRR